MHYCYPLRLFIKLFKPARSFPLKPAKYAYIPPPITLDLVTESHQNFPPHRNLSQHHTPESSSPLLARTAPKLLDSTFSFQDGTSAAAASGSNLKLYQAPTQRRRITTLRPPLQREATITLHLFIPSRLVPAHHHVSSRPLVLLPARG
jgi:hypothetical protein